MPRGEKMDYIVAVWWGWAAGTLVRVGFTGALFGPDV